MRVSNQSEVEASSVVAREKCVLRYALDRHATERRDDVFAVFQDGTAWTFASLRRLVRGLADGLQRAGARRGDRIIVMMPNGPTGLLALFAANYLGAVFVPINPALKGSLLRHILSDAGAKIAVVDSSCLEHVVQHAPVSLTSVFSDNVLDFTLCNDDLRIQPLSELRGDPDGLLEDDQLVEPWHTQSIIYTSGTTGRSKGVLSSYMHSYSAVGPEAWHCVTTRDRHLLHMPIFHIGGAFVATTYLAVGASIAVVPSFKTSTFWQTVRDMNVTVVFLLGAMATFLLKAPRRPDDRKHSLRLAFIVPLGNSGDEFFSRFGVDVYTLFNMTEISTPLVSDANPAKPNTCGRPRAGVDVRIVDEHDCQVPTGSVGQLIVRTGRPWAMNHGYNNNATATAEAWRNGWFHTGDAFCRDLDGDFFFVDRLKDTIRRRGENISSFEVEIELLNHEGVREAAAVPVPSEYTEDEVLVVVSPVAGHSLDPAEIVAFMRERVAAHMVPRFVRILGELPRTPTEKIQKHVLRVQGVTPDTWDREAAGYVSDQSKDGGKL